MTADVSVDVIIDNFNYGQFLATAIESALSQTYASTRVIVVDDGSTDCSRSIITSYGERVVALFKENGGQASAFNAGFRMSSAEAVIFLDADDALLPETAELVARAFERNPDVVKLQYRMAVTDAEGRRTGTTKPAPHLRMPQGDVRREVLTFPFDLTWMPTSGMAFRRSTLQRLLPIPEQEFRRCADWYLQHLPGLLGPVISEEWIGAEYRVHDRNSYEPRSPKLAVGHVRQTIEYAEATRQELSRLAASLGLPHDDILSVSDIASRLISRRLDPEQHPIPSDSTSSLLVAGWRATSRRTDVSFATRSMFRAWFAAMATAPRVVAIPLAERFLFPERREPLNRLLARLQRTRGAS